MLLGLINLSQKKMVSKILHLVRLYDIKVLDYSKVTVKQRCK